MTRAAAGAPAVKVCDAGAIAVARAAGAAFVYFRPYLSGADDGDCGDGAAWAGDVWADLQANGTPQPEAIGFRNECNASVQTAVQYLRYRDVLRLSGYTGKVVLGSFSTGTPDWPAWADLKAGLAGYAPDALELHEYWDLTVAGSAPWWALRHGEAIRRGMLPATWPIFVGECGSDNIGAEDGQRRRGWRDRDKLTAGQQQADLAAFVAGCAPGVRFAFVFADGTDDPHWASYRTFDTPVEAAIRQSWTVPPPAAPAAANPSGAGSGPAPFLLPRKGHAGMPAPLFQFTQDAGSADCWVECIRSFFLRYGYPLPLDTVFQAGKGRARPAGGEPASFAEVKRAVAVLAEQLGVAVQEADFDDPNTVGAALHDPDTANPWTVIAGVKESDLQAGQSYGHFIILEHEDSAGSVQVVDSYTNVDGNQSGRYPFAALAQAMIDNWEVAIDAIGVKLLAGGGN